MVVAIMMVLVAAAATRMRPAAEARRIRETARALNVYLGSARNRAMETGRPCGVILHCFNMASIHCAMNADQCEVPPSYAGSMQQSVATVTCNGNVASIQFFTDATHTTQDWPTGLVRPGDLVQLNYQGPMYVVAPSSGTINPLDSNGYVTGSTLTATFDTSQGQVVPWGTTAPGTVVSYRIFRSPIMNRSAATPLQLPASTVVDLDASGVDGGVLFGGTDVPILFSPNGSLYGVYISGTLNQVTQPIFLLVGKRERVGANAPVATDQATWPNWADLGNVWLVINPQTGLVSSGENAAVDMSNPAYWTNSSNWPTLINTARKLARDSQGLGGK